MFGGGRVFGGGVGGGLGGVLEGWVFEGEDGETVEVFRAGQEYLGGRSWQEKQVHGCRTSIWERNDVGLGIVGCSLLFELLPCRAPTANFFSLRMLRLRESGSIPFFVSGQSKGFRWSRNI